jgi:hypothetical protein
LRSSLSGIPNGLSGGGQDTAARGPTGPEVPGGGRQGVSGERPRCRGACQVKPIGR